MNKEELQALAQVAAKNIKSEQDLNDFRQMLTKITLETALNAELDDHLGYSKHEKANTNNSRNGFSTKTLHHNFRLGYQLFPLQVLDYDFDHFQLHQPNYLMFQPRLDIHSQNVERRK